MTTSPIQLVGKNGVSMVRTLKLEADNTANFYFRAMTATKIEAEKDGWYRIGGPGGWKMRIESAAPPLLRAAGNNTELLVPVTFKDARAQIVQEFAW